jgi:hypothetical protein
MKFSKRGKSIWASVEGITPFGLWLLLGKKEYFLSFKEFPFFHEQPIKAVQNIQVLHGVHLHWPDLDVDLEIDNLEHPERYPLKSRMGIHATARNRKSAIARRS